MEPQRHIEPAQLPVQAEQAPKKAVNPARKWLVVSACGFMVSFAALGVHFLGGGSASPDPLPKKVLSQVFGFTPYYFNKDTPPDHLVLDKSSPKFFGNALTFTMLDSKKEQITVSQKTMPTTAKKLDGESVKTPIGTATIKTDGGHISAELVTADKTYITLKASDFVSSGTLIDVYGSMAAAPKGIDAVK